MQRYDVIVVGAGIVGAGTALGLREADASVALIEAAPPSEPTIGEPSWDSRVYTVSPGNAEWLGGLGVWDRMRTERLTRVDAMEIFGDRAARIGFGAYEAGMRELAWVAESRELTRALWSALKAAPHVELREGARCADVQWTRTHARLELDDGSSLEAALIVGADGSDSWVRDRAGITVATYDYGQQGVVANFEAERAHGGVAYQWFTANGVLALLPLPGHLTSMVWSAPESAARDLRQMTGDELCDEVERASAGVLGRLKLITPAAAFPLKRQHVERLVEPRVALVGDAAHNIHPLAGQGVNLGLRDARELAAVLAGRGAQRDCGDYALLRRYERARREDIASLELTTDGLQKLFSAPAVWMARLRNSGLTLVDALGPVKSMLARRASA